VHYRSDAWQAYAKTHKVEEDDLGAPARYYRQPYCEEMDEGVDSSPPDITDLDAPTNCNPRPTTVRPAAPPVRANGNSASQAAEGQAAATAMAAPPSTGPRVQQNGTASSSDSAVADVSQRAATTPQPGPSSLANGHSTARLDHSSSRVLTEGVRHTFYSQYQVDCCLTSLSMFSPSRLRALPPTISCATSR
jgi:hypothetical protein